MAEDQAEADQAANVPEFNDWYVYYNLLCSGITFNSLYLSVGIVYLIKNTLMVRNEN